MVIKLFFTFISLTALLFSQTDWEKWGKAELPYGIRNNISKRDYDIHDNNAGQIVLKTIAAGYWIFISDVDGDNCPFSPTCSSFFLQSVKETNIIQGTLMFADRFTRDMDIFGRLNHYPIAGNKHFYDPPSLYALNSNKIRYIPAGTEVNP